MIVRLITSPSFAQSSATRDGFPTPPSDHDASNIARPIIEYDLFYAPKTSTIRDLVSREKISRENLSILNVLGLAFGPQTTSCYSFNVL
jgi:hypothetical protein